MPPILHNCNPTKEDQEERLWVRLGDQGDYCNFGTDFGEAADHLTKLAPANGLVSSRLEPKGLYQFEAPGFEGKNCISIFWGNNVADPIRELDPEELQQLQLAIGEYV